MGSRLARKWPLLPLPTASQCLSPPALLVCFLTCCSMERWGVSVTTSWRGCISCLGDLSSPSDPLDPHPLPAPRASGSPLKGSQTWLVTWTLRRPQGGCPPARSCGEVGVPQSDPPSRSRLVCQVETGSGGCCPRTGVCRKRGDPRGWPSWNLSTLIPSIAARERVPAALHAALDEGALSSPPPFAPVYSERKRQGLWGSFAVGESLALRLPIAIHLQEAAMCRNRWRGVGRISLAGGIPSCRSGSALRCDSGGPPCQLGSVHRVTLMFRAKRSVRPRRP